MQKVVEIRRSGRRILYGKGDAYNKWNFYLSCKCSINISIEGAEI